MGFFKKFSAPKAKIELKLNEVVYNSNDKMEGRIALDPQEDVEIDEFRVEFHAEEMIKWRSGGSRFSTSNFLDEKKIPVGGSIKLQKGQHHEQPFQINIPFYKKEDPFTEIEIGVKGVAAVKGRPDLTHKIQPMINYPYIIKCLAEFGGCGYVTEPLSQPIETCPNCKRDLRDIWERKYKSMMEAEKRASSRVR